MEFQLISIKMNKNMREAHLLNIDTFNKYDKIILILLKITTPKFKVMIEPRKFNVTKNKWKRKINAWAGLPLRGGGRGSALSLSLSSVENHFSPTLMNVMWTHFCMRTLTVFKFFFPLTAVCTSPHHLYLMDTSYSKYLGDMLV